MCGVPWIHQPSTVSYTDGTVAETFLLISELHCSLYRRALIDVVDLFCSLFSTTPQGLYFTMGSSYTPSSTPPRFDLALCQDDIETRLREAFEKGDISAADVLRTYLQWVKPKVCEFSYHDWTAMNPVLQQVCHVVSRPFCPIVHSHQVKF
jgi:hypothetical protein